jgi:hypothetical protein
MKNYTLIEEMIWYMKFNLEKNKNTRMKIITTYQNYYQNQIDYLEEKLQKEREMIEKAFEDGVGEGLTDPERPFTGKEYYDIKYKK